MEAASVPTVMKPPPGRPRRRFGQHFLRQPEVAEHIVAAAGLSGRERVLEIGPGRGALSHALARRAKELWLVEIDRDLAAALRAVLATDPAVHVVEADFLKLDLQALLPRGEPVVVVANLPYNISTPVLTKLLDDADRFSRLVLMLQREVADRLCAVPGTKAYGALSIMVQLLARVRPAFSVRPGAFTPRPKVDSAVVVIEPIHPARYTRTEVRAVRRVVRACFSNRRKQLVNALKSVQPDPAELLRRLHIEPRRRPETLTVEEFVRLARALHHRA